MSMEKSVLRWGGLSGVLAGIMSILFIVVLVVFVPPVPAKLEGVVMR